MQVVTRYSVPSIASAGVFYTDANGRDRMRRVRNRRPDWNVTIGEPVAGNYYPVTTSIQVVDETTGFGLGVSTDRAQVVYDGDYP